MIKYKVRTATLSQYDDRNETLKDDQPFDFYWEEQNQKHVHYFLKDTRYPRG